MPKKIILGVGGYGAVYTHKGSRRVYKRLGFDDLSWIRELYYTNTLEHPNIIKYDEYILMRNEPLVNKPRRRLDQVEIKMRRYTPLDQYLWAIDAEARSFCGQKLPPFNDYNLQVIIRDILQALMYSHSHGVIIRDIKEANIFLDIKKGRINRAIIADLGLATFIPAVFTNNSEGYALNFCDAYDHACGTISTQPPEVVQAELAVAHTTPSATALCHYGPQTDMWSFGIVLANILTRHDFDKYVCKETRRKKIKAKAPGLFKIHNDPMKVLLLRDDLFYYWFSHYLKRYCRTTIRDKSSGRQQIQQMQQINTKLYLELVEMTVCPITKRASAADVFNHLMNGSLRVNVCDVPMNYQQDVANVAEWKRGILFLFMNFNQLYLNPPHVYAAFQSAAIAKGGILSDTYVISDANVSVNKRILKLISLYRLIENILVDNTISLRYYRFYWKPYGFCESTNAQKKEIKMQMLLHLNNLAPISTLLGHFGLRPDLAC